MNNTFLLTLVYIVLGFISLIGAFTQDVSLHFTVRVFLPLTLLVMYLLAVPKERRNKLYMLMILFFGIGELFYVYPEVYFKYSLLFYFVSHLLFIITVYKDYIVKKSFSNTLIFTLPFILPYSVILLLFKGLSLQWVLIVIVFGMVACVNGSVVFINYAKTKNIQNYLFFIGFFILSLVDSLAGIYMFNIRDELFYLLSLTLDLIAKYMICRGFMLTKEDGLLVV